MSALAARRPQLIVGGAAAAALLVVAVVVLSGLGRPGPSPTPSGPLPSASVRPPTAADVLPVPSRTDVALLVGAPDRLTDRERQWLADITASVGRADAIAYAQADAATLERYFTIFVIDHSPDLDPAALRAAFRAGLTVHLVGPASDYRAEVTAP